jgi:hypothetical protein
VHLKQVIIYFNEYKENIILLLKNIIALKKPCLTLICLLIYFFSATAQDSHYWTGQRNPAGILVPGSAIAFTRDSGALYFNPALLAYNTRNTATISGSIYQLDGVHIKNGTGTGLNLSSTNLNITPVMASGILAIRGKRNIVIGYALMHSTIFDLHATQQYDSKFNILNDAYSPGNESFVSQYGVQNTIKETVGILSTGFKLAPKMAFGISAEMNYRKQHIGENYRARALINTAATSGLPPISNVEALYQINHYNLNLKLKAGLAYDAGSHHLGLTITSPLSRLKSYGELLSDNLISDLRVTPTDTLNLLASNRQTNLKQTWKMPLSIGAGYAYDISRGQIYFCAEYFNSVKEYNILTPNNTNFVRVNDVDDTFTSDFLKFKDARKAIVNFGVGISYLLKPDVTGFLAVRTDFSYADINRYKDDNGFVSNSSTYNLYHLQIGSNLKKRKFNLRTGLLLDYGHTSKFEQPVSMTSATDSNQLAGITQNTSAGFFSIGIMFAYMHNF